MRKKVVLMISFVLVFVAFGSRFAIADSGQVSFESAASEAVEMCKKLVNSGKKPPLDNPIIIGEQTSD